MKAQDSEYENMREVVSIYSLDVGTKKENFLGKH